MGFEEPPARGFTDIPRQARGVLRSLQLGGLQVSPDKLEGYEEPPARGLTGIPKQARGVLRSLQLGGLQLSPDKLELF